VYAEDPEHGFMPSLGEILVMAEPGGPGVRVDSGVREGDEITMFYDPMIAKLSVHGDNRRAALDRAIAALRSYAVLGVKTNIEYLIAILQHPTFQGGEVHTGFIADEMAGWRSGRDGDADLAVAVCAVAEHEGRSGGGAGVARAATITTPTPWTTLGRFRVNGSS